MQNMLSNVVLYECVCAAARNQVQPVFSFCMAIVNEDYSNLLLVLDALASISLFLRALLLSLCL